MNNPIEPAALEQLFTAARTAYFWQDKPVSDRLLKDLYELCRWAPTGANTNPMRVLFVTSPQAKQRLKPCMAEGNVEKTMSAPVTAIVAEDHEFYEHLPVLMPHVDARAWFAGNPQAIASGASYNTTLQAAYLIMAARALGLDCGPMAGFDKARVDAEFFTGTTYQSNVIINLGYADREKGFLRNPRLSFEQACQII